MSYAAHVFRVLIASPSDVAEEREIAVRTIQEWNDLNSSERQLVLLPLRWETHSAPEYGKRPQEVINRQVVDHSDLLVGVFWTRIGSPTGLADSGTLEEIERVALRGKPVMLYFSQAKIDPERVDLEQLQKLRDFKTKTFPKALVEQYSTQIEFRDKLAKQLEIQLRSLLVTESASSATDSPQPAKTDISLQFADLETGDPLGTSLSLESTVLVVPDVDTIPDYGDQDRASRLSITGTDVSSLLIPDSRDKDYYRSMVAYQIRRLQFRPLRFWLKNNGTLGARDVYVDFSIEGTDASLKAMSLAKARLNPPSPTKLLFYGGGHDDSDPPELNGSLWRTSLELRALQPQREVSPPSQLVLSLGASATVTLTARIYADTLPEPAIRKLTMDWTVGSKEIKALEILDAALPKARAK